MILTSESSESKRLSTSSASLFKATKTYYFAGFNSNKIQKCEMDEETADNTAESTDPTVKPEILTPKSCETNSDTSASEFTNTGDPKLNSMNLLVTGLRILLAKCVAVNVMMTVKAFIF